MRVVRYRLVGFKRPEGVFIKQTLQDPRGHAGNNIIFKRCWGHHIPEVIMRLTPRHEIQTLFPSDELVNLSVTDFSGHPRKIYIDHINWHTIPEDFEGCMKQYRQYIIQHEMGHAIGIYDHAHPVHDAIGHHCHPMYQQTKGTKGLCRANPWLYPRLYPHKSMTHAKSPSKKRKQTKKKKKKKNKMS